MAATDLITRPAPLRKALLDWFAAAGRDLPWRRRRSLYGTWISEMMLQQTTVAAVGPYWERFMARFPDVAALAAADEDEVLALWSGLGYYRRARHLHAAARAVCRAGGVALPEDRAGWEALPGVGPYAAGAIASIGLGERCAAVDANARRVLTRWVCADADQAAALTSARLRDLAEALVPADRPGVWNEALMELGAVVCRARDPRCAACPVLRHCRAGRAGAAALIPPPKPRTAPTLVATSLCVVRRAGDLLMLPPGSRPHLAPPEWGTPVRDDFGDLHRGLWGLPATPWYARPGDASAHAAAVVAGWGAWAGRHLSGRPRHVGAVDHVITRYRLRIDVCRAEVAAATPASALGGADAVWARAGENRPTSRMIRKVIALEELGG